MGNIERNNQGYKGYDYKVVDVKYAYVSMYIDYYSYFGWEVDEYYPIKDTSSHVELHLKRDRKIMNKVELTRLQRQFEDGLQQIDRLKKSINEKAMIVALTVGLIGTAFIAGSVFAITAPVPNIVLMIILAVPGFIGWILPIFLYRHFKDKRAQEVKPYIESKYDEIDEICEKAQRLLGK